MFIPLKMVCIGIDPYPYGNHMAIMVQWSMPTSAGEPWALDWWTAFACGLWSHGNPLRLGRRRSSSSSIPVASNDGKNHQESWCHGEHLKSSQADCTVFNFEVFNLTHLTHLTKWPALNLSWDESNSPIPATEILFLEWGMNYCSGNGSRMDRCQVSADHDMYSSLHTERWAGCRWEKWAGFFAATLIGRMKRPPGCSCVHLETARQPNHLSWVIQHHLL